MGKVWPSGPLGCPDAEGLRKLVCFSPWMVPLSTEAKRNKEDTWLGFQLPQRPTPGGKHTVLFLNFLFCAGVWQPVNNVAILSDGLRRDSTTYIYIYIHISIISISTTSKATSPGKHNLHACSKGSLKFKAAKIWGVRIQNCKDKTMHRALECSSSERGPPVGAHGHESTQHACFAHALSMQHPSSYQISAASAFGDFCVHMLYLTLCNSMDCSPLGSSVHGISQVRILEWVAIFFSRASS